MEIRSRIVPEQTIDVTPYPYRTFSLGNFRKIPEVQTHLSPEQQFDIEVVGHVLPFKVNSYVIRELIDWGKVPDDPIFRLTFPQKGMLLPGHYETIAALLKNGASRNEIKAAAHKIRLELNPHPAGQQKNVPKLDNTALTGLQHKYRETTLFFPSQGQTCHAYCTFCFRWPQFVGMDGYKFAMKEADKLVAYLKAHPEITDVLFTGGDPMVMKPRIFGAYIEALLEADLPHLTSIRIGSKALAYWPYKFVSDPDAQETLDLFRKVTEKGINLAFMAHFNHLVEMKTPAVRQAIANIRDTGATIRSQSPVLRHINDNAAMWAAMWKEQVRQGCIPYYMFVVRDTGAQHYFGFPLAEAYELYRKAITHVSGLARTVRGPSMSAFPGKVEVTGVNTVAGEKVFVLRMLQGREADWAYRTFFARFDPKAIWLDDLQPAFGKSKFFFEEELMQSLNERMN